MRYAYQGHYKDGIGHVVGDGTITVYLAGTSTLASVYAASVGGSPVNSVTSNTDTGYFIFYVDTEDYNSTQLFDITLSKTNYKSQTYSYRAILPKTIVTDPYVDLRAFLPEGFVTDGSVEYTTEIQAAIDTGQGILCPAGTFLAGTLTVDATNGLKLQGMGMGQSILDFAGVVSGDGLVFTYDSPDAGGSKYISIHDLQIKDSRGSGLSTVTNLIRVEGGATGASPSDTSAFIDFQRVYASQFNNSLGTILLARNISHLALKEFYTGYQPEAQYAVVIDNDININTGVTTIQNSYLQASKTPLYIHQTLNLLDSFVISGNYIANYTNLAAREAVRLEGAISALDFRGNHVECRDETETACVLVTGATLTASSFEANHISGGTGLGPIDHTQYGFQFSNSTLGAVSFRANEFLRFKASGSSGACYRFENDCVLTAGEPVEIAGVYKNTTSPAILSIETGGNEDAIWNGINIQHNEAKRSLGDIVDDGFVSITPPFSEGIVVVRCGDDPGSSAIITYEVGALADISGIALGANVVVGIGALTAGVGDGTDTKLNINAHTDGKLYIKNRLGSSRTVYIRYLFS